MKDTRVVVLSGAGVSAESGLKTFRDADGLWEEHRLEDVATPDAWRRDPGRVLHFYDQRRAQVIAARPNAAHQAIARLERWLHVDVVTQNIDDLHERAGSTRVLHLHGEILLARSTADPDVVVPVNGPTLRLGDRCPLGSQLRPHIVWFGEQVPMMDRAAELVQQADILVVVGTSLQVYPAASLVHYLPRKAEMHLVDPQDPPADLGRATHWKQKAGAGIPALVDHLVRTRINGNPPPRAS